MSQVQDDHEALMREAEEYRRTHGSATNAGTRADRHAERQRTRPLEQVEIETAIAAIVEDLEGTTELYAELSDAEAEAENAYKAKYHRAVVILAERGTIGGDGRRSTADWRDAQAHLSSETEGQAYRLAAASLKACKEALVTKRARLDALRTLSANVRGMT